MTIIGIFITKLFLILLLNCNYEIFEVSATVVILFWFILFCYNAHKT